MAFGTFTLTGHLDALGGAPATGNIRIDGIPEVIVDPAGNVVFIGPKFIGIDPVGNFSIALPTDVATGESTHVGFTVTTDLRGGLTNSSVDFWARAIGSTVQLADILPQVVEPVGDTTANRIAAELAQEAAETAAAAAVAVGNTNDTIMASRAGDPASAFRGVLDNLYGSGVTVNLFDFGAVGDGVTDDGAAVQAFFTYLGAHGGYGVAASPTVPSPIFRCVASITVNNPAHPFSFTGNGPGATTFLGAHTTLLNVFNFIDIEGCALRDFSVDGGGTTITNHGISMSRGKDMLFENITISRYAGNSILCTKAEADVNTSERNHIVRCIAQGGGLANNGFSHVNSIGSTMEHCEVYGLNLAGSPGYGLQLKNSCRGCSIIGGYVDGAISGVAFGSTDTVVSMIGNTVSGVTVRNCVHGVVGSWMESNLVDLTVLMETNDVCLDAVSLGGNSRHNSVRVRIANPHPSATLVALTSTANRVHVETVTVLGSARVANFTSTSARNLIVVGSISDKSDAIQYNLRVTNDGDTDNRVVYERDPIIAYSSNGSKFRIAVSNAGVVSATELVALGPDVPDPDPDPVIDPDPGGGGGGTEPPATVTHGRSITASNTGHSAYYDSGLARTVVDGDLVVHNSDVTLSSLVSAGGTLTKHWFKGDVTFDVHDVTFRACKFNSGVVGYNSGTDYRFNLDYCTIDTPSAPAGDNGIAHTGYTANRCRIGGNSDGAKINGNVIITESYIRVEGQDSGDHNDGVQNYAGSGPVSILRCNIDARPTNGIGNPNAALFAADAFTGLMTWNDNLVAGGGYVMRLYDAGTYVCQGNDVVDGSWEFGPATRAEIDASDVTWGTVRANRIVSTSGAFVSALPAP